MAEVVSEAVCPELTEDSERTPDCDVSSTACPELEENSELIPESDVSAPACPEFAEDCVLIPDKVPAPACPELPGNSKLMLDSDVPAPALDVVSDLELEEPLPINVPVAIVGELSEAPPSDDDPVYDSVFVLDMTPLVESFVDEEPTSNVDPLENKPVVMSPCKLFGCEVDVGPPSLDVLPSDKPAVAALPPPVSKLEEVPIVVEDEV